MCRIRKNKIEKIDEEDEGNSSMMQSYKSDDRKDDGRKRSEFDLPSASKEGKEETSKDAKSIERYDRRTVDSATKVKNGLEVTQAQENPAKRDLNPKIEPTDDHPDLKKRSKSNTNLNVEGSEGSALGGVKDALRLENGDSLPVDRSLEVTSNQKRSGGSARKVEPSVSYKTNSVSLLNMLQNKTLSLIKNVY